MAYAVVPRNWKEHTGGRARVPIHGDTVGAVVDELRRTYPPLERWLESGAGNIPSYTHIFLGDEDIRVLNGLDTEVQPSDELLFVVEMSGGSGRAASEGGRRP